MKNYKKSQESTISLLRSVKNAASVSSRMYLEKAKSSLDAVKTQALEAVAIKRAVLADLVGQIIEAHSLSAQAAPVKAYADNRTSISNFRQADFLLHQECDRLYRKCNDDSLRGLLAEVRKSTVGLGKVPHNYSAATAESMSM